MGRGRRFKVGRRRITTLLEDNTNRFLILFIMMGIFGAWLNAQGGWVKDFSYHRVVVLPFLFKNYTTSGLDWYFAGIADDIVGLLGNLIGIYGFKRFIRIRSLNIYSRRFFLIPITVYLVIDLIAFWNFYSYWTGFTSISLYGIYWNFIQYFGLLPSFILSDLLLLMYKV